MSKQDVLTMTRHGIRDTFLILLGIYCAGMGVKGFLLSSHFIDGGVTGISMLISFIIEGKHGSQESVWLPILVFCFNIPFIIIGYRQIGWQFAVKSIFAIIGLSICLAIISYPDVTPDSLLTAIFGGMFLGAGIGFSMRGGAVLDGTEILAIILNKKLGFSIGDWILFFNILIFSTSAFALGVDIAMYSVVTYFSASRTIDFIIHGIEEYVGVMIVSDKSEEIRLAILNEMRRGVTIYKGKRGYSGKDQDILFSIFTRLEFPKLKGVVENIDEQAFVVTYRVDSAIGGIIKKRPFHH